MRTAREFFGAFLLVILSFTIVMGGIALTLAEANLIPAAPLATQPPAIPTDTPAPILTPQSPGQPTFTATFTQPPSPTLAPTTTNCPPPPGWQPIFVQPGDTIDSLARAYRISADLLAQQNCLIVGAALPQGAVVYVPPSVNTPRPTTAPPRCGPPATWIVYTVKAGDNLYRISLAYGVSIAQLKLANCLTSDNIVTGQRIYVPNVPTRTPTNTPVQSATPTPTATITPTPDLATPTEEMLPTPTGTNTPLPTEPPTPTETNTPGS